MFAHIKHNWFANTRADILAGMVVALALIPESIAFSIIAGVDPKVGLYASFCICVIMAFVGGRPGQISAATGAMALLMVTLVRDHGLEYLLAATVLTGVLQIIFGVLKLGSLMRFVSRSVVIGFVNALAILIFMAQLPELINVTWQVYAVTAAGLAIIYGLPYITKAVPSPLVCIVLLTAVSIYLGLDIRTVGDMGELPDSLPVFLWPDVPLTWQTLWIILPYSLPLALVGLLESMMTQTIVDDLTDTKSDRNKECRGQGIANIGAGFMGGMAGCAMIGQSVINVKSGGRGRLSQLVAGTLLIILVVFLSDFVSLIPMAALVAVMIMVSIGTFNWGSFADLKRLPITSNIVMLATVAVVVWTHNLAYGVFVGVLLAAIFFAAKVGNYMHVVSKLSDNGRIRQYAVVGQVFFTSAEKFAEAFDFKEALDKVEIHLHKAHLWDITAVEALDKVVLKFRREGTEVQVLGMNEATQSALEKFGNANDFDAAAKLKDSH